MSSRDVKVRSVNSGVSWRKLLECGYKNSEQPPNNIFYIIIYIIIYMLFLMVKGLYSLFQWSSSETLVWERVTCCPVSPEMNLTWRVRAQSGLSLPRAAFRWTARRWRLRSGTRRARNAIGPSRQREWSPTRLLLTLSRPSRPVFLCRMLITFRLLCPARNTPHLWDVKC